MHLSKAYSNIDLAERIDAWTNDLQSLNKKFPFTFTEGISTLIKDEQFSKALSPMQVTEEGIVIFLRALHPLKADSPIYFTDDGIARLRREVHLLNVLSPIDTIEEGSEISLIDEQPKNAK